MDSTTDDTLQRAKALLEQDTEAAERLLTEFLAERPGDRAAVVLLFNTRLRRADFAGAEAALGDALDRQPDAPDLLTLRATARANLGQLEAAVSDLEAAIRRQPSRYRAFRLGHLYHARGDSARAVQMLGKALAYGAADDEGSRAQSWTLMMRAMRDLGGGPPSDDAAQAAMRLYRKRPLWVASSVERATNQNDYWEWDSVRKKDGLARALEAMPPGTAPRHPATYRLPEDMPRLSEDAAAGRSGPVWIVKPYDLFGGQGIRLVDDLDEIPRDGAVLVQHYVDRPFLHDGHKQHLRCYVMFTEADPPRAWFWRDGLVRFAPAPFEREPGWLSRPDMHITNTALHEGHPGIRFNADPGVETDGSVWGLAAFVDRIAGGPARREEIWRSLEELAGGLVSTIARTGLFERQRPGGRAYRPKLIGFDVLLDADLKPWLVELQRDPGQTGEGPVNRINGRLFRTMFAMTVAPVGTSDAAGILAAERAAEDRHRGAFVRL